MKIAVIQHRLREDAQADAHALAAAVGVAVERGAEMAILPDVPSLHANASAGHTLLAGLLSEIPVFCVVPNLEPQDRGRAILAELPAVEDGGGLGSVGLVIGDACMDREALAELASQRPSVAVLVPRSESDLQAEAMLELAIGLSDSLAGLVIVAECAGAAPSEPGHGGSAIVVLGEVRAEALYDDDLLLADVMLPFPQPEPREPIPVIAPLLTQRLAHHRGGRVTESGPALS